VRQKPRREFEVGFQDLGEWQPRRGSGFYLGGKLWWSPQKLAMDPKEQTSLGDWRKVFRVLHFRVWARLAWGHSEIPRGLKCRHKVVLSGWPSMAGAEPSRVE
jgi:hypothetical protein